MTTQRPEPRSWITVDQLATHLGISRRAIYDLTKARRIPHRRIPGTTIIRFAPDDVRAIEKASSVAPVEPRAPR